MWIPAKELVVKWGAGKRKGISESTEAAKSVSEREQIKPAVKPTHVPLLAVFRLRSYSEILFIRFHFWVTVFILFYGHIFHMCASYHLGYYLFQGEFYFFGKRMFVW